MSINQGGDFEFCITKLLCCIGFVSLIVDKSKFNLFLEKKQVAVQPAFYLVIKYFSLVVI